MIRRTFLAGLGATMAGLTPHVVAQAPTQPFIRWADLEIDPAQMASFEAAANVHVEAVLRNEPGVRAFHAVTDADAAGRVHVFEMYEDADAYQAHLQQGHFQAFVNATAKMVTGRQLYEMVPIRLGAKPRLTASPMVRIAVIEIDPAQQLAYEAAVSEEIDDSIRLEPGVITIYCAALEHSRSSLRFFEIYADDAAYRKHIDSPHFLKYVATTKAMITSRKLFETRTLVLALKPH